jgi:hypothetical protein
VDVRNPYHTPLTFRIIRAEHVALLAVCAALAWQHVGEVNWWRALAAFWIIDLVGYLPGAIAFRCSRNGKVHPWFHNAYNVAHTYLVTGTGVALWAYGIGGLEWAMLAVPIHLSIDRGIFGNTLKPAQLSFEPSDHSDEDVLCTLGRVPKADGSEVVDAAEVSRRVPREVLARWMDHPSGYLALSSKNQAFVVHGVPGLISFRRQGKHLWAFGGVHAPPENAGELLDRFLRFAAAQGLRVGAVQVRQSQVELFAKRRFTVNQFGSTFAVALGGYSFGGGPKMQLRNKIQRARRAGLRVVELGRDVPRDATWFQKVEAISARWVEAKGKKELDFMTGELGTPADEERRIFLAVDAQDNAVGFITYVPVWSADRPGYLHDLTRKLPEAPQGTMELCNAEAITRFSSEGAKCLHFGFTPFLIDDEEGPASSRLVNRLVRGLRKYGAKIYPADSQAAYKTKWGTDPVEREYLAAQRISFRTVFDLLCLTRSI